MQFNRGHFQSKDSPRSGRPITVSTAANAKLIEDNLRKDREVTIKKTSISRIIARKLKAKKLRPLMNLHKLTQEMKEERLAWYLKMQEMYHTLESMEDIVIGHETHLFSEYEVLGKRWTFPDEDTPRATKQMRYTHKKRVFHLFSNMKGIVDVAYRPLNQAANSNDHVVQLAQVLEKLGKDGVEVVIRGNSRVHTAKRTHKFYEDTCASRLSHPKYSPDIAPNDFWFIRKLKKASATEIYSDDKILYEKTLKIAENISLSEYKRCFVEWRKRWQRCIDKNGDYFEWETRSIKKRNK